MGRRYRIAHRPHGKPKASNGLEPPEEQDTISSHRRYQTVFIFCAGSPERTIIMADINVNTSGDESLYPSLTFNASELIPDALIFGLTTVAGSIEGDAPLVRIPVVTADPSTSFVREGAEIGDSSPQLAEVRFSTAKLANLFKQSNESATSATSNKLLTQSVTSKITAAADAALLANQPGEGETDWQPTGLFNDTTVPVSPDTYGDPNKPSDGFNAVSNAITAIAANGGNATNIVMNPTAWQAFTSAVDANGRPILGEPGTAIARQLWGVPVTVTSHAPEGKLLVLDKTAIISATGGVTLAKSGEASFTSDSITWRTTFRLGWKPAKPSRMLIINRAA